MKKTIIVATCLLSLSVYALPTYEPFTEYTVSSGGTIDLSTGSSGVAYTVATPGVATETWTNYHTTTYTSPHTSGGFDIYVTNTAATPFTTAAMSTLLPSGFPGRASAISQFVIQVPGGVTTANQVGFSACLVLSKDVVRPSSGQKTVFVSYLSDILTVGSAGAGNNPGGRVSGFVPTNFVPVNALAASPTASWDSLFNGLPLGSPFSGLAYASYGEREDTTSIGYFGPNDSSSGTAADTYVSTVTMPYPSVHFIVCEYLFNAGGNDTNYLYKDPATSTFGPAGPAPWATTTSAT